MRRILALLALITVGLAPGVVVAAPATANGNLPATIALPNGFAPEGIEAGRGTQVFVGSLADGAIWRGNVRTGKGDVIARGATGRVTVGMAYDRARDRLWVAGGGPGVMGQGDVRVYDGSSGKLLRRYVIAGAGFLNDVAVTPHAVYVTDSFAPEVIVLRLRPGGALPAKPTVLTLSGDYAQTAGFNLNGIVAKSGWLLVVQSSTGKLFRVNPSTGKARLVDLGGFALTNADGLELRGHTLYVVRNRSNLVTVVRLGEQLTRGTVLGDITDRLDVPTTATITAGRLWAVNARFGTPVTPDTEYWITRLPLRP